MTSASRGAARRPHVILRNAVRRLGREEDWAFVVNRRATAVTSFASNLARYLTDTVPAVNGSRPLLVNCLDRALDCWLEANGLGRNEQVKFMSFIRGALYPLPEALEWSVSRDNGDGVVMWNPMEQPVSEWWSSKGGVPEAKRRNRPEDAAYVDVSPADFRLIVLVRFLARDPISLTPLSARLDELVGRYG